MRLLIYKFLVFLKTFISFYVKKKDCANINKSSGHFCIVKLFAPMLFVSTGDFTYLFRHCSAIFSFCIGVFHFKFYQVIIALCFSLKRLFFHIRLFNSKTTRSVFAVLVKSVFPVTLFC